MEEWEKENKDQVYVSPTPISKISLPLPVFFPRNIILSVN